MGKREQMSTIDKILIICGIAVIVFTVTMIVIFCIFQSIPDVLVENFFDLFTGETFITFAIWWVKKRYTRRTKDEDKVNEP